MSDNSSFDPEFASPSDYAYLYRNLGLQVVPAKTPNEDPKQWKRPALRSWRDYLYEPVSNVIFDAWYGKHGEHTNRRNMGLITGACSDGIFVVDLDTHKDQAAQAWWDRIIHSQQKAGELETVEQLTGGGGTQLFFRAPTHWIPPTCKTSIGVDIRGQGGFAMLPPSMHESGNAYAWKEGHEPWSMEIADAPHWFCDEIDQLAQEYGGNSSSSGPRQRTSSSNQETDAFGRRINGREDYMTRLVWARVVDEYRQCPVHPARADIEDITRETFAIYERAVKSRIKEHGTPNHILLERENRGISLLRQKIMAAIAQWDGKVKAHANETPAAEGVKNIDIDSVGPTEQPADDENHTSSPRGSEERPQEATRGRREGGRLPFPKHLERPPGYVGKIADTILRQANRYLPRQTAIGAALASLGHASQNKFVVGSRRTPLGLYVMAIAPTGAGKGDCMSTAMRILRNSAAAHGLHGAHASGAALLRALAHLQGDRHSPCSLTIIDEVGLKLQQRSNAGDVHTGPMVTTLMELFGKGSSDIPGKTYADSNRNIEVLHNPLVTVLGFTTSEPLNTALTSSDAASGFANRFLLIEADGVEMRLRPDEDISLVIPESIPSFLKSLDDLNIAENGNAEQLIMTLDEKAKAIMEAFKHNADDACFDGGFSGHLWTRAYQNALAVAAIIALGDCIAVSVTAAPVIRVEHAEYAVDFVRWSVQSWVRRFGDEVADSPQEAERLKVLKLIRDARLRNSKTKMHQLLLNAGYMPHSLLLKLSKVSAAMLKNHIETLRDSEQINMVEVKGKGDRAAVCYAVNVSG